MERKMYTLTEKQIAKATAITPTMPTDDEFKSLWTKSHHGKTAGWGMGKRDWIVSNMKYSTEYQRGLWQGRTDKARGLNYAETIDENHYNLGYYRGYTDWAIGSTNGFDKPTYEKFMAEYVNC